MDASQVDDVHAIHRGELGNVVALEDLFGQGYHLLERDVEATAESFEEQVGDVEVHHQHISIQRGLSLKVLVLGEEGQEEIAQLLSDRLEVDLLLAHHSLIDALLDKRLAFSELLEELTDEGTGFLVANVLLRVLLAVSPQR